MAEFDGPWKESLDFYFESFLRFCFPAVHREIDWRHGYETLDKELQKLCPQGELGRRGVDKLMRKAVFRCFGVSVLPASLSGSANRTTKTRKHRVQASGVLWLISPRRIARGDWRGRRLAGLRRTMRDVRQIKTPSPDRFGGGWGKGQESLRALTSRVVRGTGPGHALDPMALRAIGNAEVLFCHEHRRRPRIGTDETRTVADRFGNLQPFADQRKTNR